MPSRNLAVEAEEFVELYGMLRDRFKGKGSESTANALLNFAWNTQTARKCRLRGDVPSAMTYARIADQIYDRYLRTLGWR